MKKIKLIGVGTISDDMKFWMISSELYRKLSDRGSELLEKEGRKFMGEHYDAPKPIRRELKDLMNKQINRLQGLRDMRTPESLLGDIKEHIKELEIKIKNKNYENPRDIKYQNYKTIHQEKWREWVTSETHANLISNIYSYNKKQYKKFEEEDIKNNNKILQFKQA